ncbi:MAG: ATP-binding protein, partial [Bacillota bacterium]|nr:ATP-binding protein [Bacillota bacterium]
MNKSSKRVVSKFIPLITAFILVIAATIWVIQTTNKETAIPFSEMEKTIQTQNGKTVSLTEDVDGSLHLVTDHGKYVSHIPPNSQMINNLVEKYNIDYTYSTSSPYGKWIIGGVIIVIAAAAFALQKAKG